MHTCGVGHRSTRDSVWFGGSTQMGASSLQVPCKVQGLGGELLYLEFRASTLASKFCTDHVEGRPRWMVEKKILWMPMIFQYV